MKTAFQPKKSLCGQKTPLNLREHLIFLSQCVLPEQR